MIGHLESRRGQFVEIPNAFLEVKDALAFPAMKVVVVPLVGSFVAGGLSWNLDASDETILHQGFQRTIDGGDAKRRDGCQGELMNLIRKERVVLFLKDRLDGLFLSCGALCDRQAGRVPPNEGYFKAATRMFS